MKHLPPPISPATEAPTAEAATEAAPRPPESEERALLRRYLEGADAEAAGALWRRHRPAAVALAARALAGLTDADQEAAELSDEVFIRCLRSFSWAQAAEVEQPFRALFLASVRNAAIDRRRQLLRRAALRAGLPAREPEPAEAEAGAEARQLAERLRAFVAARYLPSDWILVRAWMAARSAGEPVAWGELVELAAVEVPGELLFEPGQAAPPPEAPLLQLAARTLDALPSVLLELLGEALPDEPPGLALARAEACRAQIEARSAPGRRPHPRLSARAEPSPRRARLRVEVRGGARRAPDTLRMRVEKVILPRFVASLEPKLPAEGADV
jgi:DNA-directed RNA polymerase specialized sigma24 family protein